MAADVDKHDNYQHSREKRHWVIRFVCWLLQPPGWPTHVLSGAATLAWLWAATARTCGIVETLLIALAWFIVGCIWIGRLLVRFVIAAFYRRPGWAYRTGWRSWLPAPLLAASAFLLITYDVPLRTAFWLSRPAMERLARQVLATPKPGPPVPRQIGLYRAESIEPMPAGVRIVVRRSGFLFGEQAFGYAYCPKTPPADGSDHSMGMSTETHYSRLSGPWFTFLEDSVMD